MLQVPVNFYQKRLALIFILLPVFTYGQFSFQYDTSIPVFYNSKILKNPWAGGLNSGQYGTIDQNGDGVADLAVFDRTSNKLSTFIFQNGEYIYSPEYEALFPAELNAWVVLADYNCDGKKDIFTNAPFGMKLYKNITGTDKVLSWELVADPVNTEGASGKVNLQVNSSDIPGISDVDNDGDLDILVFNFASGGTIEYHQNMSMENTGNCENIDLRRVNRRWGGFEECECEVYAFGEEECHNTGHRVSKINEQERILHAGGKAILLLDYNGDGVKDLVFSDELCQHLVLLENTGTRENALFNNALHEFPNNKNPANFYIFPAAYYEDVDHDGLKDLLVAPNVANDIFNKIDFTHSSWWYKNTGTEVIPHFELVQEDFLQDEMIDTGKDAVPFFADFDGDGDEDFFMASQGNITGTEFYGTITLFENTGNSTAPEFQLLHEDYLGLSSLKLTDLKPSFGDLNGDGNIDLIFAATEDNNQKLYYLINSSNNGGLSLQSGNLQEILFSLDPGDNPIVHDVNKDGQADLIIAKASGRLEYHINNSSRNDIAFRLENSSLAGFEDDFSNRGNVPAIGDLNNDGIDELIISNHSGKIQIIENFLKANDPGSKVNAIIVNKLINKSVTTNLGQRAWPVLADLYGNDLSSLIVGSAQGGVISLKNTSEPRGGGETATASITIFPNPGNAIIYIISDENISFEIFNILGQKIMSEKNLMAKNRFLFNAGNYEHGVYILRAKSKKETITKRFIIQK